MVGHILNDYIMSISIRKIVLTGMVTFLLLFTTSLFAAITVTTSAISGANYSSGTYTCTTTTANINVTELTHLQIFIWHNFLPI
jgi:hypothetical protein